MNKKSILALLLTLVMLLGMTACGNQNEAPSNNGGSPNPGVSDTTKPDDTKTDDTKTEDTSSETPEPEVAALTKIVVYNSSLCTVLEAFGKTDAIVGAYGSLAEKYGVPSCGKWNEVDVEAVIATGAEAIFGYAKYTSEEQISQLKEAGIECYFIELSDAKAAADEVAKLGELFGCQEKAQVFVDLYNTYDALITERLAGVEQLTVYVEGTAKEPFKTANNTTAAHALVIGAGLVNIYADNETAYPERNLEAVITAEPDVVVKLWGSSATLDETLYNEYVAALAGVGAVDNGRVLMLNNECGTTAIGSIIGRLYIAKFAYPEQFGDVNVDAIYEELYTGFLGKEFPGSGAYMK